ncbi:hypothetical protein [Methanobacterium sp.]|uniref:hypothetical protein n=1 Tax=Methanobacterium sp. TaxID=2164 RepID=UPI003C742FD9
MAEQENQETSLNTLLMGILMGFTTSMWKVSGQGSGGVSRSFGEDLWKLTMQRADTLGETIDLSTTDTAMEFFERYLTNVYQAADGIEYSTSDDAIEMTVNNCKLHGYTDYLEANGVPRSCGCPFALAAIAMMEDVTGELFVIDSINSENGTSKIVLNKL